MAVVTVVKFCPRLLLILTRESVMSSFQIALYVIKCLIRAWNIKYNSIHCAANLLAGVVQYHVSSARPFKVFKDGAYFCYCAHVLST